MPPDHLAAKVTGTLGGLLVIPIDTYLSQPMEVYIGTGKRPPDAGAVSTMVGNIGIVHRKPPYIGPIHQLNSLRFLPGSWVFTWS